MANLVVPSYTPSLYQPGGIRGRFRSYPRHVRTTVPGAGYRARLVWGEQRMNLDGASPGRRTTKYGNYYAAPLLGMGSVASTVGTSIDVLARLAQNPDAYLRERGPQIVSAFDRYVVGPGMDATFKRSAPYMLKWLLPPIAVLYVLSGLAAFYSYQSAKRVRPNLRRNSRRRRRSRR